ncbi:hypothetical protein WDW86_00530 [Bdellovibrionota bacterium FG-2]
MSSQEKDAKFIISGIWRIAEEIVWLREVNAEATCRHSLGSFCQDDDASKKLVLAAQDAVGATSSVRSILAIRTPAVESLGLAEQEFRQLVEVFELLNQWNDEAKDAQREALEPETHG